MTERTHFERPSTGVGPAKPLPDLRTMRTWWHRARPSAVVPGHRLSATGSAAGDLSGGHPVHRAGVRQAVVGLLAESQHHPVLADALHQWLITARRAGAAEVLRRGMQRGELPADLDVDIAIDALYEAIYCRLLVSHQPLSAQYARTVVDEVFVGLRAPEAAACRELDVYRHFPARKGWPCRVHDVHPGAQPAPPHVQPAQPAAGDGMAAATRWPSKPPASSSPTAPIPATPTIMMSAEPPAPKASPPPAAQTAPAASTGGAATRLAATKAASERSVAGVRTPANRLRGSRCRQPSRPTVISPLPAASSTTPRSADADTVARIPAARIPSTDPLW